MRACGPHPRCRCGRPAPRRAEVHGAHLHLVWCGCRLPPAKGAQNEGMLHVGAGPQSAGRRLRSQTRMHVRREALPVVPPSRTDRQPPQRTFDYGDMNSPLQLDHAAPGVGGPARGALAKARRQAPLRCTVRVGRVEFPQPEGARFLLSLHCSCSPRWVGATAILCSVIV